MDTSWRGQLLSFGTNAKTVKSDKYADYLTAILYLAPADIAGPTLCPWADKAGCKQGCLNTAGRGAFSTVQEARIRKTKLFNKERKAFVMMLMGDIASFVVFCREQGKKPAV